MRAAPQECLGAYGGDDSVGAVHGCAGEYGDAGAVQALPNTEGYGGGFAAGDRGTDSDYGIFSGEGEEYPGRGQGCDGGVWGEGSADDGGVAKVAGGGAEDGECGLGVVVWVATGSGGGYACDADLAATGADETDGSGEG